MAAQTEGAAAGAIAVEQLLARRERWVDLGAGLAVRVRRPAVAHMHDLLVLGKVDDYLAAVTAWRGFTAATVLGATHGSVDSVTPFDPALWRELALDHVPWCQAVSQALQEDCAAYLQARDDAAKN